MARVTTTSAGLVRIGALIADETRAEILCALMDGRAHTGSELARHIGVSGSTVSEHLSKLCDADLLDVEAQGRHRYWRLRDPQVAGLLESLGARASSPADPRAPADLVHARTCYDHLAGELAVQIYERLLADGHLAEDGGDVAITPTGLELLAAIGADVDALRGAGRSAARPCLDWTQRRHHLAGAAGKELLRALIDNGWIKRGQRPRSVRITEAGRKSITRELGVAFR
ncbi:MAG TPA: metalloregulator ArsR/SmtB family transcription factor [Acidimicrobiales bacterium]